MAVSSDYLQYVLEQLSALTHVTSRRMFSGVGLYCDGVFFGLIDDDTLFFKVDDANRGDYLARNMPAFRPFRDKPDVSLSYFEVPADALEDRDELAAWARKSVAAAVAGSAKPRRTRPAQAGRREPRARGKAGSGARTASGTAAKRSRRRPPVRKR